MAQPKRILWFAVLTGMVLSFVPAHVRAQVPPPPPPPACDLSPFLAPTSWTGSITTTVSGSGTITISAGDTVDYNIQQSIQMSPVLAAKGGAFAGAMNASVNVNESYVETIVEPGVGTFTNSTTVVASGFITLGAGGAPTAILAFSNCNYYLTLQSYPPIAGTITTNGVSTPCQCGGGPFGSVVPTAPVWAVPVPSTGTTLSGSNSFDAPAFANFGTGPYPAHITTTWSLTPATDLDVLVTIADYDTWRPTGGLNEKETGIDPITNKFNYLVIHAKLVQKNTGQEVSFSPGKWTFSLVQVSHEPGVAMNWPAKASAGRQADMTFDKQACATPLGCEPVSPNQIFTITPSDPNFPNGDTTAELIPSDASIYSSVTILLSPHDWGGWATLNVTATVGSEQILGHLELPTPLASNANETDILLPQRQAGSFVADSWKSGKVPLSTLDEDDSENKPSNEAGHTGDGLTLYEEYRGFYMGCTNSQTPPLPEGSGGCQHVEGDPLRKDLFIVDEIPTIANGGVAMFKQTSTLNVHYLDMTLDDIGAADSKDPGAYRAINFNHSAAPHEKVDQHALLIGLGEQTGYSFARGGPGLPKQVDLVLIESDYQDLLGISQKYIDAFVAHELAHGVNVHHHGDIDGNKWWYLDSQGNVHEQDTDSNDNPIPSTDMQILVMPENQDPASPAKFLIPNKDLGLGNGRFVYVGNNLCGNTVVMHGQHSGDVSSYMRYDSAAAYIPAGFPFVRFWIVEPFGLKLTDHPTGTYVNDANRKPRPRYGDAYGGDGTQNSQRGNDFSQIDVNDNNTAIVKPDQRVCP